MAAENVGTASGMTDIPGRQQQNTAGANIRRPGRELSLPHRPDQRRRLLLSENFGDMPDLRFRQTRYALDLRRGPLVNLLTYLVEAIDPLVEKFLIFPTILKNVPEHAIDGRDVRAWTHPNVLGGMRCGPCHARIDDDHIGAI